MSVHDVNFASVIDLHERLQRNDGVQSPGPLYVTLGTKPDFAKRLANLVAGAAEGKGMSDLISWDEESDDFDENVGDKEQLEVTDQHAEGLNASAKIHENDFAGEGAEEEQSPERVDSEQNTGSAAEGVKAPEDHSGKPMPEDHGRLATSDNVSSQVNVSEYSKDGLDEDGDLIDYEDEEYEQSRETSTSANVDSSGKQHGNALHFITPCSGRASCTCPCMKHPLIYDEENKSELDQHPPAPAPEEDGHHGQLDPNAPHSPSIHSDQYHGENANHEADNEEGDSSGYQEHDEYEGDEGLAHEQTGEEFYISYDGIQEEDEGKNGNVAGDIASSAQEVLDPYPPEPDHQPEATETRDGDLEEIDYNSTGQDFEGFEQTDYAMASAVGNQGSASLAADKHDHEGEEISYEEADIPDSNESERTLIADESAPDFNFDETKQEQNDEINYDTDDQQELNYSSNQNAITESSPLSNGHTGKRQRADAEDATDRASKRMCSCSVWLTISNDPTTESKRARS
jgi:hypothetical protein